MLQNLGMKGLGLGFRVRSYERGRVRLVPAETALRCIMQKFGLGFRV